MQAETPNSRSETVESTTTAGLKFLDSLKQAKDKTYVTPSLRLSHWQLPYSSVCEHMNPH